MRYDALLLVSFGGPEGPDDVVPFLENVTRGRGIPRERLVEVGAHYTPFGGVSPINEQNRALLAAHARPTSPAHGLDLPVYWGNRNWDPYLADALARDARRRRHAARSCIVTSAYASYSGCRQYRENLADAVAEVEADGLGPAPRSTSSAHYFDHPGFVEPMVDAVVDCVAALADELAPGRAARVHHALDPDGDSRDRARPRRRRVRRPARGRGRAGGRGRGAARRGARTAGTSSTSRAPAPRTSRGSSPTSATTSRRCAEQGVPGVVIVPIGFVSDHMEVVWDLDTVALRRRQAPSGCPRCASATVGTDPRFVAMVRELVLERVGPTPRRGRCRPWGRGTMLRRGLLPQPARGGARARRVGE